MKKFHFLLIILFSLSKLLYSQTPLYYPGYPNITDDSRHPFQKSGGPLITDLNNDGQKEIIIYCYGAANPGGMLYVIKSDGSNFANFPKGYNDLILDIVSGDIDGDGYLDIAMRMANSVDVIDRFGNHLPGFPVSYPGDPTNSFKPINIYDLDNDGKLEILVCRNGESTVFNYNGAIRAGWPQSYTGICYTNSAIGDLDNDGFAEIVTPVYTRANVPVLRIYKQNGDNFSNNWPILYDSAYYNWGASPSLIINKYNSDSTFIVMSSMRDGIGGFSDNRLTKYNIYGDIINRGYNSVLNSLGTLVIGDIDRDGKPEFTNSAQGGPYTTLYTNKLIKFPNWANEGVGENYATPTFGKLSFSNDLNVAVNNWSAYDPVGFGNVFAYNKDGSPLPWSPLRPIGLVNSIALADINFDGSVEIIATSSKTENETYLHIWTVPGIPFSYEDFPWSQNGHDRYKSNQYQFIPPDEPVGIQPSSTIVPDKFSLHQNFPNPFNPATTIKFDIINPGSVNLSIFDALGRQIETLVNERLKAGTYSLTFDGSKYNSGVYFYRLVVSSSNPLTTDRYSESRKMLMVK